MSLPDIKTIRDRSNEVGECWIWAQGRNSAGHPQASHEGQPTLVRRRAFELAKFPIPEGRRYVVITTCREVACVNPDHLELRTRSQMVKQSYKLARNTEHEYPQRLAARLKSPGVKMDHEKAEAARVSTDTAEVEALKWGVSVSTINKIRAGESWRPMVRGSSVFNHGASANG